MGWGPPGRGVHHRGMPPTAAALLACAAAALLQPSSPHASPGTCAAALEKACGAAKRAGGATACEACALRQWSVLRKAGCSEAEELAWCQPPPPAPAPDLSGRAFLTHATQKIMPDTQFTPCATPRCLKRGVFGVAAAQNEYEPFLVVLNGPLTNVSIHDLRLPAAVSAIEHRVYRVEYVNVVNVSDCDSPGPGRYPDALIPAVDEYVNETRNALPVTVPANQSRVLWVDLFVPPGSAPGTHEGGQLKLHSNERDIALPFKVSVLPFALNSTSSMSSLYNTPAGGIFAGHRIANYTDSRVGPVTQENVDLVKRYLEGMLMHRVSGGSLLGADGIVQLGQTEPPCPLCGFDAWTKEFGTFIDGRDTPFGLKQARITAFQMACNSQIGSSVNSSCPIKHAVNATAAELLAVETYWRTLLKHFQKKGWEDLLFDYTMDEPHTVPGKSPDDWKHLHLRASAAHAVDPALRTLVTTEFCEEFQDANGSCVIPPDVVAANRSGDITLWVPQMPFLAGRSDIPKGGQSGKGAHVHCKDVPLESQREVYDFIPEPKRHLWWYLACFAEGGCCAGPQRKCTPADRVALAGSCSVPCFMGWPSYMVDHTAIRNRMVQWATFRYDVFGELVWNTVAAPGWQPDSTDAWDQLLFAGGNGEGTLWFPGRESSHSARSADAIFADTRPLRTGPDKIGGKTHIPVASLRL